MAGIIHFGKNISPAGFNSAFMSVFGEYIRDYIKAISTETENKVYESYDLYDESLDFSGLSHEEYMQCYRQIKKSIEVDLNNTHAFYNNFPKEMIYEAWKHEIEPKMKASPHYNSGD